jgi:hypothetical protein
VLFLFLQVIREMLTSLKPEGENGHFLVKMEKDQIEERLYVSN